MSVHMSAAGIEETQLSHITMRFQINDRSDYVISCIISVAAKV